MVHDEILGLDGGGSKTIAAVADRDGSVVALARGPGLDPFGNPRWPQDLAEIIATVGRPGIGRAVLGLSAHTEIRAVSDVQTATAEALFTTPVHVLNDVHVAHLGALAGRAGVLALAGTGSMAWAGDGHGVDRRTGGWGDIVGDEGSGYWIGRKALSETTRALDGRSGAQDFARAMLGHIGVAADGLIGWIYGLPNRRAAIAALAVAVNRLAEDGNPTARLLIARAADHLTDQVEAAWRLVTTEDPLIWSHAGGLFASRQLLDRMTERLGRPAAPALPPVGGALLEAARRSGWIADADWYTRLATALRHAMVAENPPMRTEGERNA